MFDCRDVPDGLAHARIRVESDATHYNTPLRGGLVGAMHPITELVRLQVAEAVAAWAAAEGREASGGHSVTEYAPGDSTGEGQ